MERVFIVGASGKVGRELLRHTYANLPIEGDIVPEPMMVVGLANKAAHIYSRDGITERDAVRFAGKELNGTGHERLESLIALLREEPGPMHIVDATGERYALGFHIGIVASTPHSIVTANKNPLVYSGMDTFSKLVSDLGRYRYSCSVMAGAGAVECAGMIREKGDGVAQIEGCLSGTAGFVLSGMELGVPPSAGIEEAVRLGYAEPDWGSDMDGSDSAKKILILARSAGMRAGIGDVAKVPIAEGKRIMDGELMNRMRAAMEKGMRLRYIARMRNESGACSMTVGLEEVLAQSDLGRLEGPMNKIIIRSDGIKNPLVIEAPGAGIYVTAQNIRRDILYQARER